MQPRLIHRLSRCLAIATAAVLAAAPGAVATTPSQRTTAYYDHAVELIAKGDPRGAVVELKNALEADSKDLAARVLLGRTYVDLENGAAAVIELSRARKDGAQDSFVLVPLGRAYLLQGEYGKLLSEIRPAGQDNGTTAEIITLRGDAHRALGENRQAAADYRKASKMRPKDAKPLIGLARVKLAAGDRAGADNAVKQAMAANANDPGVWLIQGQVAALHGDPIEALKSFDRAIELAPNSTRALDARAAIRIDQGAYDAAEPDIQAVRKFHRDDPQASYLLSLILSRRGKIKAARDILTEAEQALRTYPAAFLQNHPPGLLLAGVVACLRNDPEAARRFLGSFLKQVPRHAGARKLLAALALAHHEPEAAVRLLDDLKPRESTDVEVLTIYGNALMQLKRYGDANRVLERAATVAEPGSSDLFRLVAAQPGAGWDTAAITLLKAEMARNPEAVRAAVMMGAAQLRMEAFQPALDILDPVIERAPNDAMARNLAGEAYVGLKNFKAARANYQAAIEAKPDYLPAIENLAKLEVRLGHFDDAVELFSTVLEKDPANGKAMITLAEIARRRNDLQDAIRWLEKARAASRDRETAALKLIDLYIGTQHADKALAVARALHDGQPDDLRYLTALGRAQLAAKQGEQAAATFRDLAARAAAARSVDGIYHAAMWQWRARDEQGARDSLNKALAIDPRHRLSHLELYKMDFTAGNLDAALARARTIASLDPSEAIGDMLQGDVYMQQRHYDSAVQAYHAALKKKQDTALADRAYHARRAAGQDALDFAVDWAGKHPDEVAAQRLLATAYADAARPADAIRIYQRLLAKSPKNIAILNGIALLYAKTGDAKAIDYARRAYDAAPTQPVILDSCGWMLVQAGKVEQGLTLLRDAKQHAPNAPDIRYHIAVALNTLGQTDKAVAELRTALDGGRPFGGMAEARALLAKLSVGKK